MSKPEPISALRALIGDVAKGPLVAEILVAEIGPIVEAINADDVMGVPYSDEELLRRVLALGTASDRLSQMSALAGYWAPIETARVWPQLLSALLSARDRGNGVTTWLDLLLYPPLLTLYAFGIGASAGRRYDSLALILSAPTPDERKGWHPAVLQLNSDFLHETAAAKLPNAKSRRWAVSDHLYVITRPWFAEIIPSDAEFEREFDRFEILASLVYFDLQRGDSERVWSPIGRFARHGRYDVAIARELIAEAKRVATETILLADLASPDLARAKATMVGFDEHVSKALAQVF